MGAIIETDPVTTAQEFGNATILWSLASEENWKGDKAL